VIPLSTTTIDILRTPVGDIYDEPYGGTDPGGRDVAATGIRAVIDRPTAREQVAGGEQSIAVLALIADPCDLTHTDLVRDTKTGRIYSVVFVIDYGSHVEADLRITEGVV
jgi:hypothetical protein